MIMVHWLLCLLSHMNNGGLTCVCIMCLICDATLSASPSLLLFILMEQDESIFFLPLPLSFQSCQPLCQWEKWFLRVRVQQRGLCSSPSLPLESTHMQMGRCGACGDVQSLFPFFFFFALLSFPPFYLICRESGLKRTCDIRYVSTMPITKRASEESEEEHCSGAESVGWTEDVHCFFYLLCFHP